MKVYVVYYDAEQDFLSHVDVFADRAKAENAVGEYLSASSYSDGEHTVWERWDTISVADYGRAIVVEKTVEV